MTVTYAPERMSLYCECVNETKWVWSAPPPIPPPQTAGWTNTVVLPLVFAAAYVSAGNNIANATSLDW